MKYNAEEFYPTPRNIITEMLSGINLDTVRTILEPSAGKGDIIKYLLAMDDECYRNEFDIGCLLNSQTIFVILRKSLITLPEHVHKATTPLIKLLTTHRIPANAVT